MKNLLLFTVLVTALSISSCGNNNDTTAESTDSVTVQETQPAAQEQPTSVDSKIERLGQIATEISTSKEYDSLYKEHESIIDEIEADKNATPEQLQKAKAASEAVTDAYWKNPLNEDGGDGNGPDSEHK